MKLQKCAFTSRILVLSLSVSASRYCMAPSMYSTNVGCRDMVSRSRTQVLQYVGRKKNQIFVIKKYSKKYNCLKNEITREKIQNLWQKITYSLNKILRWNFHKISQL